MNGIVYRNDVPRPGSRRAFLPLSLLAALLVFAPATPVKAQQTPPQTPPDTAVYPVSDTISIRLSRDWHGVDSTEVPPPAVLASYGPPFHFFGVLSLTDTIEGSILQVATSDNPLAGHDPYWLDTQMHASNSGMSVPDFLFYFFLPPSLSCMNDVSQNTANASRISPTSDTSPSDIEVFYSCPFTATLSDFYAARVSPGITFRKGTDDGSHASGVFGNFYLAPMEQVDFDGMTFFVFEAQQTQQLTAEAVANFDVPDTLQGTNADFFWAIGAVSPFPFVADSSRKDNTLIHVAYAAAGIGPDKRAEFMDLLHHLRANSVPESAGQPAVPVVPATPDAAPTAAPSAGPSVEPSPEPAAQPAPEPNDTSGK